MRRRGHAETVAAPDPAGSDPTGADVARLASGHGTHDARRRRFGAIRVPARPLPTPEHKAAAARTTARMKRPA